MENNDELAADPTAPFAPSVREHAKTVGVVLEGGGFRGMYTAGVLDVWMEHGLEVDAMVGVSAGAAFGCNYKSRQIGRAVRYNKRFCTDPRYAGLRVLLKTGDLYSRDFAYREVPLKLDVFDTKTFSSNPMRFTVVCTDVETGRPVYRDLHSGDVVDIDWIRASASIPVVSRPVELEHEGRMLRLLDGGAADPIPVAWMASQGYAKQVAVLTQPKGFRKQPQKLMPVIRRALRGCPRVVELLEGRHERYNAQLDDVAEREAAGDLFVIRPSESVKAPAVIKDPQELEDIYQVGRRDGEATYGDLLAYLAREPHAHHETTMMIETLQVPLLLVASKGADPERVASVAAATGAKVAEGAPGGALALRLDEGGLSLERDGMVLRGDFADMLPRLKQANLSRELLVRAAKIKGAVSPTAVDATAGLGQDSLLLAAAGFTVTMFESDPVIAALLQDALDRAATDPRLEGLVARMTLVRADSIAALPMISPAPDVVYLDPMFPERTKSAAVKKKFQLLHHLESPCEDQEELLRAALLAHPRKVVVKRPVKGPHLAGVKPSHTVAGKAVRYDCIVPPRP